MRKLATIQRITKIENHPNADRLEIATVLGWKSIIAKGSFKEGDLCIYCEIDSILPDKPEYDFLKKNHFRVRTVRLRGIISQGLILPMSSIPPEIVFANEEITEGMDCTNALGISQYIRQVPADVSGEVKGSFPFFIPKTDETRVQVLQKVLDRHKGTICYITEKADGCSGTFYLKDNEFGVCSRNLELKETDKNSFWKYARELKFEEILREIKKQTNKDYALQGELIGNGIQGNPYKMESKTILIFNIFNITDMKYLNFDEYIDVCNRFKITTVPLLSANFELINDIPKLEVMAMGTSELNNKVQREGIVIRPLKEILDLEMSMSGMLQNGRVSFKSVNKEYLLENE